MRLLSGNPGMYQHSIEQNTEGETTQQEPEHGEDTIARVKGHFNMNITLTLTLLLDTVKLLHKTNTIINTMIFFTFFKNELLATRNSTTSSN